MKDRTVRAVLLFLVAMSLAFAIRTTLRVASGGEKQLCQMEPKNADWHYRTKVDGVETRCWYDGPRMKPRDELYWAETPRNPTPAMEIREPMRLPWEHDERFKGETR